MTRLEALRTVLDHVIALQPLVAVAAAEAEYASGGDPYLLSLQSFSLSIGQRFEQASVVAARALDEADDVEAELFALAATAWAGASWPTPYAGDAVEQALARSAELDATAPESRAFTLYLLAEAALGSARLDLAARIVDASGAVPEDFLGTPGQPHPYLAMMQIMRVRLHGFQGRVNDAIALLDSIPAASDATELLVSATRCLLVGNNAQRQAVRALAQPLL